MQYLLLGSPNALTVTIGGGGAGEFGPRNPTRSTGTTMSGPGPIPYCCRWGWCFWDHHMVVNLVVQVVVLVEDPDAGNWTSKVIPVVLGGGGGGAGEDTLVVDMVVLVFNFHQHLEILHL